MKVLIISLPRTGSTTLMKALGSIFNLETVNEPFYKDSPKLQTYPLEQKDNFIEKSHINHKPSNTSKSSFDFFCDYYKEFDKVILLGRKDLDAMTESFIHGRDTGNFHNPYTIPKSKKFKNFKEHRQSAEYWVDTVLKFSQKNNIPITWYEDLYSGNKNLVLDTIKLWNLRLEYKYLKEFIDPIKKYRKTRTLI